jgi:hypothetical protein
MTSLPRQELAKALSEASGPSKRPTQGQHAFTRITVFDSSAVIECYNGVMRCSSVVGGVTGDDIDLLVHAEMLSSAIENTNADTVEITPDTNRIKIKVGSRNASVPTLPIKDNWVDRQERRALSRIQVTDHESFVPILKIAHGITKLSKRDEYKHVEFTLEPGIVRIACTSGHQIMLASCECTTKGSGTVALPVEAIDEILKSASSSMLIRTFDNAIAYNSGSLSLESSVKTDSQIATPMIQEVFTKSRTQDASSAILDRVELISAIKSADTVSQKRAIPSVKMEIEIAKVVISCDNSETSVSSEIGADTVGVATFRFAASDIVNTLAKLPGEKIQVEYPPESPTVFFLPHGNENILIALQIIRNE